MRPWPQGKAFAFTIIDDTDEATLENIKPVYDFLDEVGIYTTKTIWVLPSRDGFKGETLLDASYQKFILELQQKGYEIAFHGAGSGNFLRDEILLSLEQYRQILGEYPKIHINHGFNRHNLYWGYRRFSAPIGLIYKVSKKVLGKYSINSEGEKEGSPAFWGDVAKEHIQYIRNRVYSQLNTLKFDSHMPYREKTKEKYTNYWFSSSDGERCKDFLTLLSKGQIDKLEKDNGCAIVYTHFAYGFVDQRGELNQEFKEVVQYLSEKNGWFVPAGKILDWMKEDRDRDYYLNWKGRVVMDIKWGAGILKKLWRGGHQYD